MPRCDEPGCPEVAEFDVYYVSPKGRRGKWKLCYEHWDEKCEGTNHQFTFDKCTTLFIDLGEPGATNSN